MDFGGPYFVITCHAKLFQPFLQKNQVYISLIALKLDFQRHFLLCISRAENSFVVIWLPKLFSYLYLHCVQTDLAKNVWTRAYLIPERNRTVRQEEGKNSVYLFVFCMNLGEINALLTISCCQMKHFGYVIVY